MHYLSGKEPHRQVGVGRVVASGNLGGVMVRSLARNARDVGSIPTVGTIILIFITPMTLGMSEVCINTLRTYKYIMYI